MKVRRKKKFPVLDKIFERVWRSSFAKDGPPLKSQPPADRLGFLIAVFDRQISSSGFQLWVVNEFTIRNEELLEVLRRLDVRHCADVRRLIRETEKIALRAETLEEADDEKSEAALNRLATRCERMDEAYDLIREEFLSDVEAHLKELIKLQKKAGRPTR